MYKCKNDPKLKSELPRNMGKNATYLCCLDAFQTYVVLKKIILNLSKTLNPFFI